MAKSQKKPALGRGLSALLQDENASAGTSIAAPLRGIQMLELSQIKQNPNQPRTQFSEENLQELARSIETLGIIQPITVRKIKTNAFEIVSGERRFRAAKIAKLSKLPVYIREANDQELLEMALVENIQREDLDPIEIGLSYQRLLDEIGMTQEKLSERVGKKRSTIANYVRLLKLDPIIQSGMRDGFLSMGHGRALINIENHAVQLEIYEKVIRKGLSVRATEALVKQAKTKNNAQPYRPPFYDQVSESLKDLLETGVTVKSNSNGKGSINIVFDSQEKLQHILNKIRGAS